MISCGIHDGDKIGIIGINGLEKVLIEDPCRGGGSR